jgi:uncharacterized cofD-like protein
MTGLEITVAMRQHDEGSDGGLSPEIDRAGSEAAADRGPLRSVVAFGGGTGLGRLLSALSYLGERLTGVVTTTDDGGSTGRLRQATGCIAWGDLRHCFNQICTEATLGRLLFEYRFANSGELSGHNLGNLMLLALDQLTARPVDAVNLVRDFLDVAPALLPMSEQPAALEAADASGETTSGECAVAEMTQLPRKLWLAPEVSATPEVLAAIAGADVILMGPGSFITSVLPSLLVDEIRAAVAAASCPRVLIANLAPEPGPVGELALAEQLEWMERVLGVALVDAVLWPASCELGPPLKNGGVRMEVAELRDPETPPHRPLHHRDKLVEALVELAPGLAPQGALR